MKAFIDTSALIKKYVQEKGSDRFDEVLKSVSEIVIAPVTVVEICSALHRRMKDKSLTSRESLYIQKELDRDVPYFSRVIFNEVLEKQAVDLIERYPLKTLDSLQLASGMLAGGDLFVTSDKQLARYAGKVVKKVILIE